MYFSVKLYILPKWEGIYFLEVEYQPLWTNITQKHVASLQNINDKIYRLQVGRYVFWSKQKNNHLVFEHADTIILQPCCFNFSIGTFEYIAAAVFTPCYFQAAKA